jgi:large subunit ribosomal protein L25
MSELKLQAQPRTVTRRKVGQLRTQGLVPVVVYGKTQAPLLLQVNARSLDLALHQGGFSQLVKVEVEGGDSHNVLIREVQRHPVNRSYIHADFYAVNMAEKQHVSVQITGVGHASALTTGLMMLQPMDSVMLSALPADIPANIEVDVTGLEMDKPILVADLPAIPGVEYLSDPHEHVFTLIATRVEEIEEEAAVEEDAEPEVVTRGHQDEDEEEE